MSEEEEDLFNKETPIRLGLVAHWIHTAGLIGWGMMLLQFASVFLASALLGEAIAIAWAVVGGLAFGVYFRKLHTKIFRFLVLEKEWL